MKRIGRCFFLLGALTSVPTQAFAQLIDSLTVALLPAAVNFTLAPNSATNAGDVAIGATTTWSILLPTRTSVKLYGYFSNASSALAHSTPANTVDIPAARIEVSVNGGVKVPFDQSVAFGAVGAGRLLVTQAINVFNLSGHRTDSLTFNINLNGYPMPADSYVGTLRIRAQATP